MNLQALNQKAAADLLGVTSRSLRDWEQAGEGVPRNKDGTYPAPALVGWWVARNTGEQLDANRERARKDKEHADKLALENARTRAETVAISQVVREVGDMLTSCRGRLIALPDVIGQTLDTVTARTVVPAIRGKIYEALAEIASYRPALSGEAGEADGAAADADGERVVGSVPEAVERKQRRVRTVEN